MQSASLFSLALQGAALVEGFHGGAAIRGPAHATFDRNAAVRAQVASTAATKLLAGPQAQRRRALLQMQMKTAEITMPALSSTMTEGKISQWLMNEGDKVEVGDMVLVVESDKADMDVETYEEGYIAKILVGEGESAAVGSPVALLVSEEAEIAAAKAGGAPAAAAPAPEPAAAPAAAADVDSIAINMPALSSTMTEGKISQWLVNVGDKIEAGDMVLVVESDKADMDVESYEE